MPFVRVNCGVNNKGDLVEPIAVEAFIRSQKEKAQKDWYVSPYIYPDEVMDYWKANKNSISYYTGDAWTDHLYWDLDKKGDIPLIKGETIKLVNYLINQGFGDGIEVYFSGQKGFHVTLRTVQTFKREELAKVCSGVIKAAGVTTGFDTSVYNITRILRYPHTKHQDTGLFKIPLDWDQLTGEPDKILTAAEVSGYKKGYQRPDAVDVSSLAARLSSEEHSTIQPHETDASDLLSLMAPLLRDQEDRKRRCIEALEAGDFGPGERDNALIRLAAYYRGTGHTEDEAFEKMTEALQKRAERFPDAEAYDDEGTRWKLSVAYGPNWKGGMFSCRTDEFLQTKCMHDGHPCFEERVKHEIIGKEIVKIGGMLRTYVQYGEEAHLEYPKFGLPKLDERIRVRPKQFSILAGAAGVGKTSYVLQMIDSLNEQKINHLFFSLDMSDNALFEKLAARHTSYTIKQIEQAFSKHTRNEAMVLEIARQLSAKLPFTYFDFISSTSMRHIEESIIKLNRDLKTDPVKVVFVDYAGRILGGSDNAYANATANALQANDVAKKTETHIMFLAQISRESGDSTTPLRSARVAKESGSWEENASLVMTCWRPFGDGIKGKDHSMVLYIAKNRSVGWLGELHFHWEGKTGSIREMTTDEYNEYMHLCAEHEKDPPPPGDHPEGFEFVTPPEKSKSARWGNTKTQHTDNKNQVIKEAKANGYDSGSNNEEELPDNYEPQRREKTYRSYPRGP